MQNKEIFYEAGLFKWQTREKNDNDRRQIYGLLACKIRSFMVVWRYENERESRGED